MMRRKTILFGATSIAVGLGIGLLLCESLLRWMGLGYGSVPQVSDPILHHANPSDYVYRIYDPSHEYGGHLVRFDHQGLVTDPGGDSSVSPGEASRRVAFLGDSFVAALQTPFRDSFVGRLSAQARPGVAVKNFGVSSYSPSLYLLQWKKQVRDFHPTDVFLLLYANDVDEDAAYASTALYAGDGELLAVPGPALEGWTPTLRKSYVVRFVRMVSLQIAWAAEHWGEPRQVVGGYVEENPDVSELSSRFVLQLARRVGGAGAHFTLMAVPSKYRLQGRNAAPSGPEFARKWQAWAEEHGIDFLDLVGPFHQAVASGGKMFFDHDIHFSAAGHHEVAEVIRRAHPDLFGEKRIETRDERG